MGAGDNTVNMAQIFDAYYKLIENPGFANASRPAGDLSFADQYMCAPPSLILCKLAMNADNDVPTPLHPFSGTTGDREKGLGFRGECGAGTVMHLKCFVVFSCRRFLLHGRGGAGKGCLTEWPSLTR